MGETRVNLLHLLEDLADAYPGELEETILTEIVANSLDSRATTISFITDLPRSSLTVVDDGVGMRRAELRRFHDIAATTKERGQGIGFAGVGIKLGLLVSSEVVTETRRGDEHVATSWALNDRKRALWQWTTPPGLVGERGTAVQLHLQNPLSPLLDAALLETLLGRHFEPLFDPFFDQVLTAPYPAGVRFVVNGRELARQADDSGARSPIVVRLARKRKPAALGYLVRHADALPEGRRGIAISTFGKVIKRGWDWLGLSPSAPEFVNGMVEAPGLSASLTLNKADFLRTGPRGAVYLSYRKILQEAVSQQLAAWGDGRDSRDKARSRAARPVERDVETVLLDLAEHFPMLAMLVERRSGGQRRLPMGRGNGAQAGEQPLLLPSAISEGEPVIVPPETSTDTAPQVVGEQEPVLAPEPPSSDEKARERLGESELSPLELPARRGKRRPTRLSLTIQFESRPDDPELGRLVDTTVWVNDAHPAYVRAAASRAESYHLALAVAMALARVAVEPSQEHGFVSAFLGRWGEAVGGERGKRRHRRGNTSAQGRPAANSRHD